jgi:hypothetical protein
VFISGNISNNVLEQTANHLAGNTLDFFAALITLAGPVVIDLINPWPIFTFFAFMMVLQLIFVYHDARNQRLNA